MTVFPKIFCRYRESRDICALGGNAESSFAYKIYQTVSQEFYEIIA